MHILTVLVMFLGVSQQFLPDTTTLMQQAASGQIPTSLNKETIMQGLDTYKDQIAEKGANVTGLEKEKISAGIDWVKNNKERFMEEGTEAAPTVSPPSISGPNGAPTSHPIANGDHPAVAKFKEAAKKAIAPQVAANMPKDAAKEGLDALKEKQQPAPVEHPEKKEEPQEAATPPAEETAAPEEEEAPKEGLDKYKEQFNDYKDQAKEHYENAKDKAGEYYDKSKEYLGQTHQKLKDLHKAAVAKIPKEVMGHEVKPWMKWAVVGSAALCAMVCISYPAVLCYNMVNKRNDKYGELDE